MRAPNQRRGAEHNTVVGAGSLPQYAAQSYGAEHDHSAQQRAFRSLDTNSDGFLSRDEAARAQLTGRFQELDLDRDGKLSQSELGATTAPAAGGSSSTLGTPGATVAPGALQPSPGTSVTPPADGTTVPGSAFR